MSFTDGRSVPEAILTAASDGSNVRVGIGATVTSVPNGYTATIDAFGNLTVTGPAAHAVAVSGQLVGGVAWSAAVDVAPTVQALSDVRDLAQAALPASGLAAAVAALLTSQFPSGLTTDAELTTAVANAIAAEVTRANAAYIAGTGMAADLSAAGHRITNLLDPTSPQDAATRAYVLAQLSALVNGAPALLDTLGEIAAQLATDESAVGALTTALALKAPLASPALTGTPTAPTAAPGTNTTQVATTGFTTAAVAVEAAARAAQYATSQPLDSDLTTIAALDASTAGVLSTDGAGWIRKTYAQLKTALSLVKADVGLGNVDNTSDVNKPVSTAQAAAIAAAAGAASLVPTAVKTSAYSAAVGDYVPVDTTSGNVTITLPTAPADKAQVGIKHIIRGGTNTVTLALGGSDVLNKTGGSTSATLTLVNQAVVLQYKASSAIWYVVSGELPLSGLDARYALAGTGLPSTTQSKTSAYTALVGDFVQANTSSGGFTVTLPAAPATGALVTVKKVSTDPNTLTIVASAGGTIDGDVNATTATKNGGAVFEHLGSNAWQVSAVTLSTGATGLTGATGAPGSGGHTLIGNPGWVGGWYPCTAIPATASLSNRTMPVGTLLVGTPTVLQEAITIDKIGCYLQTAGGAGGLLRMGVWQVNAADPFDITLGSAYATLLVDAGTVASDSGAAAPKTITLATPLTLAANTAFVIGIVAQVATAGVYVEGWGSLFYSPWGATTILNGVQASFTVASVTGSLPTTLTPAAFGTAAFGGAGWFHRSA